MKLFTLLYFIAASLKAQLPPATFEWEAPHDMTGIVGYRLEWGPQDSTEVPVHQTLVEVSNLPFGLLLPVSVSSVGTSTNSEPTTIYVYNLEVMIEEADSLLSVNWQPIGSVVVRGQRKPTSFLRLRLKQGD